MSDKASQRHQKRISHDFLPADDEANRFHFWVPSPDEIEAAKREIRAYNDQNGIYR